ncbi:nitrous oxide-stimulated promoter family protein [uncultured Dubosiella sp.]|uniref:nitrous oxide-stimulated promoter family protein n=1 Tax=uncultured Dubosiella sp. TaxID=1937011 RepID=UPI00259302A8|nr:nitrous oxide-stimulated promoter family protein [uncultured Dubosiella sp.]
MKKDKDQKRKDEIRLVSEMIRLYYKHHEGDGQALIDYATLRINKCPFMETKTFCSACKVHCYRKEEREQIRAVMRYAGPRMLLRHPVLVIRHLLVEWKEKREGRLKAV